MKGINGRLLYLFGDKYGLLFKNLSFYVVDFESGLLDMIAPLPVGGRKRLISHNRLANRLIRLEPRCAGELDEKRFVVCVVGKLWVVDIQTKTVSALDNMRPGYSLLNFCESNGCLYWGDYGTNPNHDKINIYQLDGNLNQKIVYSFPKGSIRHIHNIIKDGDGFIIMAGDNEPQAGIYHANADWAEVKPWKCGEQRYRAVVGFPYKGGLLYATDSVETENHIRLIEADGTEKILEAINGSCIYGGEIKDYFLFSTTVEPHEGRGKLSMLSYRLGGGIKSREVHVIAVSKKDLSVKIVKKFKKDIWPMKPFQYGRAIFAGGQEQNEDGFWCSPVACKGVDGKSVWLTVK